MYKGYLSPVSSTATRPLKPSKEIFQRLKDLEWQETKMMEWLFE